MTNPSNNRLKGVWATLEAIGVKVTVAEGGSVGPDRVQTSFKFDVPDEIYATRKGDVDVAVAAFMAEVRAMDSPE